MPANTYRKLRIEIFPFAQVFRPGDRLRITLDAPGGARPLWAFDTLDNGQQVTVANDARHPSLAGADRRTGVGTVVPAGLRLAAVAAVPDVHRLTTGRRYPGDAPRAKIRGFIGHGPSGPRRTEVELARAGVVPTRRPAQVKKYPWPVLVRWSTDRSRYDFPNIWGGVANG